MVRYRVNGSRVAPLAGDKPPDAVRSCCGRLKLNARAGAFAPRAAPPSWIAVRFLSPVVFPATASSLTFTRCDLRSHLAYPVCAFGHWDVLHAVWCLTGRTDPARAHRDTTFTRFARWYGSVPDRLPQRVRVRAARARSASTVLCAARPPSGISTGNCLPLWLSRRPISAPPVRGPERCFGVRFGCRGPPITYALPGRPELAMVEEGRVTFGP